MNRRWAGVLVAFAACVVVAAIVWLARASRRGDATSAGEAPAEAAAAAAGAPAVAATGADPDAPGASWRAQLYFPAASDRLVAEEHEISSGEAPRARAAALLATLLATAPGSPRVPVFPVTVEVGRVLLLDDGTLVADLRAADAADPPASGSTVELLRVYALVHTVLRNVPEATQVVLLWNGRQRPSFAGHVDTARPLRARAELDAALSPETR